MSLKISRGEGDSDAVGDYAEKAISKAFRKMVKHEREVLDDIDIEALHQMRIGLRRLRTTILTFEHLLGFPEAVQDVTLKPLAKRLGRVRDLDVLLLALSERYLPHVPTKEGKVLKKIRSALHKKRDRQFKRMKQFLLSESYRDIKTGIRRWCKQSCQHGYTHPAALWPIRIALPDLLLPVLSQTLLHPG